MAPSKTLWSAVMLKLIWSVGLRDREPSSSVKYFGVFTDLPIAIMAACGLRMVGTKYLPPIFPTLETEKDESSKSLCYNSLFWIFFMSPFKSLLISNILF